MGTFLCTTTQSRLLFLSPTSQNIICDLLSKHVNARLRVSGRQEREGRGIHHSQAIHAVDPRARIDDSHRVVGPTHLARCRSVVDLDHGLLDELEDLSVRGDLRKDYC